MSWTLCMLTARTSYANKRGRIFPFETRNVMMRNGNAAYVICLLAMHLKDVQLFNELTLKLAVICLKSFSIIKNKNKFPHLTARIWLFRDLVKFYWQKKFPDDWLPEGIIWNSIFLSLKRNCRDQSRDSELRRRANVKFMTNKKANNYIRYLESHN